MQRRSIYVVPLTIAGTILLLISPLFFDYPPFGWVIWALITLLYLVGMRSSWKELRRLEGEQKSLEKAKSGTPWSDPQDGSEVSYRIQTVERLSSTDGRTIDFSEILSAKESSRGMPALAGAVVMLGLIGTFYGLMAVIAVAGPAVQQQSTSYDVGQVLQPIFSGMRGIFGTSLCGLVAALLLNLARSLHREVQMRFMAEIEEFTRFRLLPTLKKESTASGGGVVEVIEKLTARMEQMVEVVEATTGTIKKLFTEQFTTQLEHSSRQRIEAEAALQVQKESATQHHEAMEKILHSLQQLQTTLQESVAGQSEKLERIALRIEEQKVNSERELAALEAFSEQSQGLGQAGQSLAEIGALIRANQVEFQSGLEMFARGVEELLEGIQRDRDDESAQNSYLDRLERLLANFSERATETLAENSLHSQEILLELLNKVQGASLPRSADRGEGQ